MAALRGTRIDRNTTSSSRKLRATTPRMKTGRRPAILSDRSMNTAVEPVTRAVAPVPAVAVGRTVSRSRFTRLEVAAASGADLGTADRSTVLPDGLVVGGLTAATSGSAAT